MQECRTTVQVSDPTTDVAPRLVRDGRCGRRVVGWAYIENPTARPAGKRRRVRGSQRRARRPQVDGVGAAILQSFGQVAEDNAGWVKNLAVRREARSAALAHRMPRLGRQGRQIAGEAST
jgi:hypothetical protein